VRYLFHNVYGDTDELIASKPDDVINVPFGWSEEIEVERNRIINELGITVSSLPSLIYFVEEYVDIVSEPQPVTIPAHWKELRITDLPKPWTWEQIKEKLNDTTSN
jgi:hypothetical protein